MPRLFTLPSFGMKAPAYDFEGTGNVADRFPDQRACLFRLANMNEDMMSGNTVQFTQAVGHSVLRLWADLPRDIQERLFEDAAGTDEALRHQLALYLHDRHPRTAHPPKPTAVA
jgi:hypothetical protein